MRVIVTSTYENVDSEWLEWWLNRIAKFPENVEVVRELREGNTAAFSSKDPSSQVVATTTYEVQR